jgi:hypothetical protein
VVSFPQVSPPKPYVLPIRATCLAHLFLDFITRTILGEEYRVPVTTTWRVIGLRVEERPPIWRVAVNILNKQSRTADYYCSHWNSNEKLKEKSGSYTRKTFDRYSTADSCTGNSTHNTESAAV